MRSSLLLLSLLFIGAGCTARPAQPQEQSTQQAVQEAPVEAPTISVSDQSMEAGTVVLGPVSMTVDGWLVAYGNDGAKPGQILGYVYVQKGDHEEIILTLEDIFYTGKVYIAPHFDRGLATQFEFPGPDMPFEINGTVPVESFMIE